LFKPGRRCFLWTTLYLTTSLAVVVQYRLHVGPTVCYSTASASAWLSTMYCIYLQV